MEEANTTPSIGIIGAGSAGLITAQVLLRDGFDVQVITRDPSVGGIWASSRVYPGLSLNNVQGEFQFSPLPMKCTPSKKMGNRLSGYDMCNYMETFAEKYMAGKIQFNTEVLDIRRSANAKWAVRVERRLGDASEVLEFDRIVLCTGGCSTPYIPSQLLQEQSRFRGIVLHSSDFRARLDGILSSVRPRSDIAVTRSPYSSIIVVGGGRSAQDIAACLANEGREVKLVFETADALMATPIQLPASIRKSRLLGVLSPHWELRTRLERFLHKTWIGGKIVHFVWNQLTRMAFYAASVPSDSPLRRAHSLFWGARTSDEGVCHPNGFHALVNSGKISLIAPRRAAGFTPDGKSLILDNGETLAADVVIFATGYTSSWNKIIDADTAQELGINRHPLEGKPLDIWNYTTLRNPPPRGSDQVEQTSSIYRGIVPAKNICWRDFAINGGILSTNSGYAFEVVAHWISSYFLGDKMRLPSLPEEALNHTARNSLWLRKRYPSMLLSTNESSSGNSAFWTWPQMVDELLEDMHLPSRRSGGNWLTWPFKVIDMNEIRGLAEERQQRRRLVN